MVVLATAAWIGVLLAYSLLIPLFRAPDELQHVDLVVASRTAAGYVDYDNAFIDSRVAAGAALLGRPALGSTGQSGDATVRSKRPTLVELGTSQPAGRNQQTQHPPLYYASMGAVSTFVTTVIPGEHAWSFDRLVYLFRLLNIALVAAVPAIAYRTSRRIGISTRSSLLACLLVMSVPQFAHIGSSVNNDNLVVLLGALVALGAASVSAGDLGRRRALMLGALVGLALLTKATALVLIPMVPVAYALRGRSHLRTAALRVVQSGLVALAVGGWWYVRNLVRYGTVQPSDSFWLVPKDVDPVIGDWAERFFYLLPVRFWGQFGYLEEKLNRPLVAVATVVVLAGIGWAVVQRKRRGPVAMLLVPFAGSIVLVARKTWSRYLLVGRPIPGIQGRYLFLGIVGLMVAVGSAVDALPSWLRRRTAGAGGVLLVAMHAAAVATMVRGFWGTESEAWTDRLDDLRAFAPLPEVLTNLVFVGTAVAVAALVVVCIMDAVRSSADDPEELPVPLV